MDDRNERRDDDWQRAFREQATAATMEAAVRCGAIELARLDRLGAAVTWSAEDVVQSILAATVAGEIAWEPAVVGLRAHLRDKIRLFGRRARRGRSRTDAACELSLDAFEVDDAIWDEPALATHDVERSVVLRDLARRVEAELWHLAADDSVALRVLAAMSASSHDISVIAAQTTLSERAVRNARRRLRLLASQLSPAVRAATLSELGRDDSAVGRAIVAPA